MKLSFSTLACPDWNLDKIVDFAVTNSYDGVELRIAKPQLTTEYSQQERLKLKKLFAENNLEIPCITAYTRFGYQKYELRQDNLKKLKEIIDLAADIGAKYIRTFGPVPDNKCKLDQVIRWIKESFLIIDNYAEQKGIKILLESHDDLCQGKDLIKIFEDSNLKSCGVLWDVAHSIRAGEKITETISYLKDYIYHVHLKDWLRLNKSEDRYVLLGAGELPLNKLINNLAKINYCGYFSFEWEKVWHPEIEESELAIIQYSKKMRNNFLN